MNKFMLYGSVYRKGTIKDTENGHKIMNVRVFDFGGKESRDSLWIDCTLFNRTAILFDQFVENGDLVILNGSLKNKINKEKSGQFEMLVSDFQALPKIMADAWRQHNKKESTVAEDSEDRTNSTEEVPF